MHELIDEIEEAGARLIAISPNTRKWAEETADMYDRRFPVLADLNNEVAGRYGLKFALNDKTVEFLRGFLKTELSTYNDNPAWELPVPATYLIDTDGIVRWVYANEMYRQRPTGEHTLEVVKHFL